VQPHIGRWHCRYRIVNGQPEAALAAASLEKDVRSRVLDLYSAALEQALEDDPAVYILRQVHVPLLFHGASSADRTALARKWAARTAREVIRGIVKHAADSSQLVRFSDEAEYISYFIADLLDDAVWQRWYYGPFSRFRLVAKNEAVLAVLLENREQLEAILRHLAELGRLRAALDLLDESASGRLWREAIQPPVSVPSEIEFRTFVRAAYDLINALELWAAVPPSEDRFLSEYVAERPTMPDWMDRRSLASAVLSVVRFAARRSLLARIHEATAQSLHERIVERTAALDWLDFEWLVQMLAEYLTYQRSAAPALHLAVPAKAISPYQRLLFERLRQLVGAGMLSLDSHIPDSGSNALGWYAALVAVDPELASKAGAASAVKLLLACWKVLLASPDPITLLEAIRSGAAGRVLAGLAGLAQEAVRAALTIGSAEQDAIRAAAAIGAPAADVLTALIGTMPMRVSSAPGVPFESHCAGLYLLLRALIDVRVPQMAAAAGAEPLSAVLLALGIQWAGEHAVQDLELDRGLALWCGLSEDAGAVDTILGTVEPQAYDALAEAVRDLMTARRMLDPSLPLVDSPPQEWMATLNAGWPLGASVNLPLVLTAIGLLQLWARWLPGISNSSLPYLLTNLIRRSGVIEVRRQHIDVVLRPAPLDVVLEMSGYLAEISAVPWLEGRKVTLRIDRRLR
jgi:hypothetical protein